MATVAVVFDDLLFGSKMLEALGAAGHKAVHLSPTSKQLSDGNQLHNDVELVVVDLAGGFDGVEVVERLRRDSDIAVLAAYPHVQTELRDRALAAGVDKAVPRSRLMRDTGALVDQLLSQPLA